jgi:hypothetical protein
VGRITKELPLSALVIVALFSDNFVWIDFINFASGWGFSWLLCCWSLQTRSATCFL